MSKTITELQREVRVMNEVDVVVVGGGPAGLAAALAAARSGVDVALVERYGYIGGMATGGLVLVFAYMSDPNGQQVVKGIAQEIVEKLHRMDGVLYAPPSDWGSKDSKLIKRWRMWNAGETSVLYDPVINPEYLKILGNRLLHKANVKTLFHAWVCSVVVQDETIQGIIFESKSGRLAVLAKVIVDCSGDGDVFAFAGVNFERKNLPLGLVFRIGGVDTAKAEEFYHNNPDKYRILVQELEKKGGARGGVTYGEVNSGGNWLKTTMDSIVWFNSSLSQVDTLNIEDLTLAENELREQALVTLKFFRENIPGFERSFLLDTAPQLGTRTSRRLKGEHVLTRNEIISGKDFGDVIATCSSGVGGSPHINIPFGSLLPEKVDNLLVAGRCISTDFATQTSTRLIPACMATGQAAGTAAALAVRERVTPRNINRADLQSILIKNGVHLNTRKDKKKDY